MGLKVEGVGVWRLGEGNRQPAQRELLVQRHGGGEIMAYTVACTFCKNEGERNSKCIHCFPQEAWKCLAGGPGGPPGESAAARA